MNIFSWIKKEFFHIFPIFAFFLIGFVLINQVELFLLRKAGISPIRFLDIVIAAALIAKVVAVMDFFPVMAIFKKRPLAQIIVWKTLNYWIILLIIRVMIRFVPYAIEHGKNIALEFITFSKKTDWSLFISIQFFYLMFLFIYVTFDELRVKIGSAKMKKLFFG